ncbi:DUF5317 domain-containing protein [Brevibacillus humidisoli]|uniref:DUF5317 domain-containing protein n=1 Tax=Brevibacillus humidisoli TaxID=2895522 RepID=UPI001E5DE97D|nr:DUF5317 domain-containing protein [Brevibacillus humidisoli]UFJ40015.1 DUF5317 domain-containing protein [Brevibacillus humidisoli]
MSIDIILLSFVIAFLRGGRLRELPKFHKLYFLVVSILLQVCSAFMPTIGGIFVSIAYIFTLLFFFSNREHEDIRVFMIGWFLNAITIWSNYGKMPIDLEQAKKLPYSLEPIINGTDFKHSVLTEASNLPFLADIVYMPFPIERVISIGDMFIMLGAFLLVQRIMNKPISLIRLREGSSYAAKN